MVTTHTADGDIEMEIKGNTAATPFYNVHYQSLIQDLPILLQWVVQLQRSKVTALTAKQTRKKEIKEKADAAMDDDMLSTKSIHTIIAKEIARVAKTGKGPKGKGPKGGNKTKCKKDSSKVSQHFHPYPKPSDRPLESSSEEGQVVLKGFRLFQEEVEELQEEQQAKGLVTPLELLASDWAEGMYLRRFHNVRTSFLLARLVY